MTVRHSIALLLIVLAVLYGAVGVWAHAKLHASGWQSVKILAAMWPAAAALLLAWWLLYALGAVAE